MVQSFAMNWILKLDHVMQEALSSPVDTLTHMGMNLSLMIILPLKELALARRTAVANLLAQFTSSKLHLVVELEMVAHLMSLVLVIGLGGGSVSLVSQLGPEISGKFPIA